VDADQLRLIWDAETAFATSPDGVEGALISGNAVVVKVQV
jgi:hypothetical protein